MTDRKIHCTIVQISPTAFALATVSGKDGRSVVIGAYTGEHPPVTYESYELAAQELLRVTRGDDTFVLDCKT